MVPPLLRPVVHSVEETPVCTVALGLTAYLEDPAHWARGGAARALTLFLEVAPRDQIAWYVTSLMPRWQPIVQTELGKFMEALSLGSDLKQQPRHFLSAKLADVPNCPEVGFAYTEIQPERATRAGTLELTLPVSTPPERLLLLAKRLAELGPLHSLVGGYVARWSPRYQRDAFDRIYLWTRRYAGLDVQWADEMAWQAPDSLPGVSWLTLVGTPLAEAAGIAVDELKDRSWQFPVQAIPTPAGLLLRAGEEPSWGDLNAMDFPQAYAEVARQVADALPPDPPRFWGAFMQAQETYRWHQRFLTPKEWALT